LKPDKIMEETGRGRAKWIGSSVVVFAGVFAALLVTSPLTLGFLTGSNDVSNTGILTSANVGVYTTQKCTTNLTRIGWGRVLPGSNYTKTGYVRNNGNVNMTLGLSTSDWSPASANIIGLSWNYNSKPLVPGQVLAVTWRLNVPSTISGVKNFSFNIVVSGDG
jgi:hypothetical protein